MVRADNRSNTSSTQAPRCVVGWSSQRLPAAIASGIAAIVMLAATPAAAQPVDTERTAYFKTIETLLQRMSGEPPFVALIDAHNRSAAAFTTAEIEDRDARWRAGDDTLIEPVLANALSVHLAQVVADSGGQIAEIIVMGVKGCNIAASSRTSDYWQGDEAKFRNTAGAKTDDWFVDRVDFDQSTKTFSQQISKRMMIAGRAAGAITVGFDIRYRPKDDS